MWQLAIFSKFVLYVFQIQIWHNRLNIFDGSDILATKIGEVYGHSENNKNIKSLSSSGMMFIDFKRHEAFKTNMAALIKYNKFIHECQTWLDLEKNTLISPDKYDNNFNCNWLLSSQFGSYINLTFEHIYVSSI